MLKRRASLLLWCGVLQGMFPAINVQRTKLRACQRVVLLSRDKDTGGWGGGGGRGRGAGARTRLRGLRSAMDAMHRTGG